jgi:hypothetical protein
MVIRKKHIGQSRMRDPSPSTITDEAIFVFAAELERPLTYAKNAKDDCQGGSLAEKEPAQKRGISEEMVRVR